MPTPEKGGDGALIEGGDLSAHVEEDAETTVALTFHKVHQRKFTAILSIIISYFRTNK